MQDYLLYIGAILISMGCGFAAIPVIIQFCLKHGLYDQPNGRKIHHQPIPRLGGISFVPGMLLTSVIVLFLISTGHQREVQVSLWSIYFIISLLIIYATGIVDDLVGLNATVKFSVEIAATCILPAANLYINNLYGLFGIYTIPFWIGAPLTILVLVFTCNAINLIDGIDGLSTSLTIIALIGFFICFHSENLTYYCVLIAALVGVLIPYLYYNVFGSIEKRQKIFMGDSGSLSLGFILGFLAVKLCMDTPRVAYDPDRIVWAWSLLAVPCFDVVRVFFFRIIHGRSPFQPDKNHIHHKLMACGLGQHQALVTIVAFQLLIIATNIALSGIISSTVILCIDIAMYFIFNLVTNLVSSQKSVLVGETQHITK
jgi:UDP-GlcNAc:undecaprenyl-phosphate GlcNAc-1-phosphate transferase